MGACARGFSHDSQEQRGERRARITQDHGKNISCSAHTSWAPCQLWPRLLRNQGEKQFLCLRFVLTCSSSSILWALCPFALSKELLPWAQLETRITLFQLITGILAHRMRTAYLRLTCVACVCLSALLCSVV